MNKMDLPTLLPPGLLFGVLTVLAWSAVRPFDRLTWFMEVLPVLIGLAVLIAMYPRFRFTPLVSILIAIHMVILVIGGHYTYERMPLFDWIRDTCGLCRNHYDRLGHLAQGFIPALVAREILLRTSPLKPGGWLFFIVVCFCLALSAFYELIEWRVAMALGNAADSFLALQGDVWDTQWDMFFALCGAIAAQLLLDRVHDRQLARIGCLMSSHSEPRDGQEAPKPHA